MQAAHFIPSHLRSVVAQVTSAASPREDAEAQAYFGRRSRAASGDNTLRSDDVATFARSCTGETQTPANRAYLIPPHTCFASHWAMRFHLWSASEGLAANVANAARFGSTLSPLESSGSTPWNEPEFQSFTMRAAGINLVTAHHRFCHSVTLSTGLSSLQLCFQPILLRLIAQHSAQFFLIRSSRLRCPEAVCC